MHPTLRTFYKAHKPRFHDLIIREDEDFDLVMVWEGHEVYVRVSEDGFRILFDCDGGKALEYDETDPVASIVEAFVRRTVGEPMPAVLTGSFGDRVCSAHRWRVDGATVDPAKDDAQPCSVCICSPCGCDTEE